MAFSSSAAPKVVKMKSFGAASDDNAVKMTFLFPTYLDDKSGDNLTSPETPKHRGCGSIRYKAVMQWSEDTGHGMTTWKDSSGPFY